jgi:hypothetical protein
VNGQGTGYGGLETHDDARSGLFFFDPRFPSQSIDPGRWSMGSRARTVFRPAVGSLVWEGLEKRRLLSGGKVSALAGSFENDRGEAKVIRAEAPATQSAASSTAEDQPTAKAAAGSVGGITAVPAAADSTADPTAPLATASSARGLSVATRTPAPEDETAAALKDAAELDEPPTRGPAEGAALSAAGSGAGQDSAVAPSSVTASAGAQVSGSGMVSMPQQRDGAATGPQQGAVVSDAQESQPAEPPATAAAVSSATPARPTSLVRGSPSWVAAADGEPSSPVESPDPLCAGLAADFLLLDRDKLQAALDRFLDQFDSIAAELARFDESTTLLGAVGGMAMAALASEAILRRNRSRDKSGCVHTADVDQRFTLVPGLPGSRTWATGES